MTATLRPMNLGEILDRTFHIYRSRFLMFVGVAALPALGMMCLHLIENPWLHGPPNTHLSRSGATAWNFLVSLAFYHVAFLIGLLFWPAHVRLTSTTLFGETSSFRSALRFALVRWRRFLWIAFLKLCAELVIPEILASSILAVAAFFADRAHVFDGVSGFGLAVLMFAIPLFIAVCLFFWTASSLSLAVPVAAMEEMPGWKALRRSWTLSEGSRLRIQVAWVITTILAGLLAIIGQLMLRLAFPRHLFAGYTQHLYLPASRLLNTALSALIGPIFPIALTLFYYDQRMRREGYDIERLMDAAGLHAPAPSSAPVETSPALSPESTEPAEALP